MSNLWQQVVAELRWTLSHYAYSMFIERSEGTVVNGRLHVECGGPMAAHVCRTNLAPIIKQRVQAVDEDHIVTGITFYPREDNNG